MAPRAQTNSGQNNRIWGLGTSGVPTEAWGGLILPPCPSSCLFHHHFQDKTKHLSQPLQHSPSPAPPAMHPWDGAAPPSIVGTPCTLGMRFPGIPHPGLDTGGLQEPPLGWALRGFGVVWRRGALWEGVTSPGRSPHGFGVLWRTRGPFRKEWKSLGRDGKPQLGGGGRTGLCHPTQTLPAPGHLWGTEWGWRGLR